MDPAGRRSFMKVMTATPFLGAAFSSAAVVENQVKLFGDGLALSPAEYVDVLQKIIEEKGLEADFYSQGGVVEELESKMAEALGKERAIYFPTGTLANHIAVRELAYVIPQWMPSIVTNTFITRRQPMTKIRFSSVNPSDHHK